MATQKPIDIANYNFDRMVNLAKKRLVDEWNTIDLMQAANSEIEKEEIALLALLDVGDDINDLQLLCRYSDPCQAKHFRDNLRKKIWKELQYLDGCEYAFM